MLVLLILNWFWAGSGQVLGRFRADSEQVLGRFWAGFGQVLGRFWADSGKFLGKFWANSWQVLGRFYHSGEILSFWADSGKFLGKFWAVAAFRFRITNKIICFSLVSPIFRCIFSGSRGEVCTFEPLSQGQNHPLSNRIIVALATISKVIVLTIRPVMKVLFTFPLIGGQKTLPLLSWQFVIIQTTKSHKVVDPVLAFGRQNTIHFYQLSETLSERINFIPLQKATLPFELLNMGWLNTRCMALLDTSETFHLYDVRNSETLESIELTDVQLVYGTPFFKGNNFDQFLAFLWHIFGLLLDYFPPGFWRNFYLILTHFWPIFDQFLTNYWPIFDAFLTNFWPIFDQFMTNFWPIYDQFKTNFWLI